MVKNKDRVVQTGLRIRVSLRDRLEKEAKLSGISLNSEMERRLEASFGVDQLAKDVGVVKEGIAEIRKMMFAGTPRALADAAQKREDK